jgi:predicted phosphohydrolase
MGGLDTLLHRQEPSWLEKVIANPVCSAARSLYHARRLPVRNPQSATSPLTLICISDTHNCQPHIPPGDLLVHAGDLTQSGSLSEVQKTLDWLNTFPHTHKVVVAGNHDLFLDGTTTTADHDGQGALKWGSLIYLQDSSTSLTFPGGRRLKVYGSPWTRKQGNWAFQYPRCEDRWSNTIPDDTDVLVTHSPPRFHLDLDGFGDENLLNELWRVRPRVHVFGHIHAGYGQDVLVFDKLQEVYERILKVQTPWALVWMLLLLLYSMVAGQARRSRTILINASIVGGLHDDKMRASTRLVI